MASASEQLVKYLTDAHAIEEQALAQLRAAPDIAGDPELSRIFAEHLIETEEQERIIRARLDAHGASPSKLKDTVMAAGGKGFVLFARSQPDTPGKLAAHAISYENLEAAAYELLSRVADIAGDRDTAEAARLIRAQELAMSDRLQGALDRAVDASLREQEPNDMREQLRKYLADAHAIEAQALQLLEKGQDLAGDPELARIYAEHLDETRDHEALVRERLEELGGSPTPLKDASMRVGVLNWGAFFAAQPDTRASWPPLPSPSSTSRSPATRSSSALPREPAISRPSRSSTGSWRRNAPLRRRSQRSGTAPSTPPCARSASPLSGPNPPGAFFEIRTPQRP
jgi:ferritin-like metal-binding protein YciE